MARIFGSNFGSILARYLYLNHEILLGFNMTRLISVSAVIFASMVLSFDGDSAFASGVEKYFGHLLPGSTVDTFTGHPAKSKWSMVLDVLDQLKQKKLTFDQANAQLAFYNARLTEEITGLPWFVLRNSQFVGEFVRPLHEPIQKNLIYTLTIDDPTIADDIFKASLRNIGLTSYLISYQVFGLNLVVEGRRHQFIPALGDSPFLSSQKEVWEPGLYVSYELNRKTRAEWANNQFEFISDRNMPALAMWLLDSLLNDRGDQSPVWQKLESLGYKNPYKVFGYKHDIPAFQKEAVMSAVRTLLAMGYQLSLANKNQSYFINPDVIDPSYVDLLYYSTFSENHQLLLEMSPTKSHGNSQSLIKKAAFLELYRKYAAAIKILGDQDQSVIDVPPNPPSPYIKIENGQRIPRPLIEALTRVSQNSPDEFKRILTEGPSQNWDFGGDCAGMLDPANRSSTRIVKPKQIY